MTRRGVNRDIVKMPRLNGRNANPDASGPKPSTFCTYCTTRKNIDSCAPTTSAIIARAATRVRLASRAGWIIGCATRRSVNASSASESRPRAKPPSVRAEPHPWSGVPISAQTIETAPTVAVTAPTTSNRPGRRTVSVTKSGASASTASPIGTLMNIAQRHEPMSVSTPPSSRPMDAPPEETAPNSARARCRSASSRAEVVSRASTLGAARAAPTPWRARAATSSSALGARPPSSEASTNTASPASKTRSRPSTSPSRPPSRSSPPKASV